MGTRLGLIPADVACGFRRALARSRVSADRVGNRARAALLTALLLSATASCRRNDAAPPGHGTAPSVQPAAATQPGPAPASQPASPIHAEAATWSREECCRRLHDPKLAVSAAFRLMQMAGRFPESTSTSQPDRIARLRVVALSENFWGAGFDASTGAQVTCLEDAVRIDAAGEVAAPLGDGGAWRLYVSRNDNVIPDLFTDGRRLVLAHQLTEVAMVLKSPEDVYFAVQVIDDVPCVVLRGGQPTQTLARYSWDPYEENFFGPASDLLPGKTDARFELDLPGSPLLQPVGGLISSPPENQPPPETVPPPEPL